MYSCEYWKIAKFLRAAISKNICKQVLVCTCVRACVCVCLYASTVKASSDCKTSETYLRGTDQRCYVEYHSRCFCQIPSSTFLKMSYIFSKDPQRRKLQWAQTGEKTAWYMVPQKYIYWYSQPPNKPTSDEKILKMRRLL